MILPRQFQHRDLVFLQEPSAYVWSVTRSAIKQTWRSCSRGPTCAVSASLWAIPHTLVHSVILGGVKYRPATPRLDMAPQIVWLVECFIADTTYFLFKRLPNGRLMCMWRGTNCCMVHSSEINTFFHSARVEWRWRLAKPFSFFFISGVRCGFHDGLWDFSPSSLLAQNSAEMYCYIL